MTYPLSIQTKTKINKNKREVCEEKGGGAKQKKGEKRCKKERKEEKKKRKFRNQCR